MPDKRHNQMATIAACVVLVVGILHFFLVMGLYPLKTDFLIYNRVAVFVVTLPAVILAVRHLVKKGWLDPPDAE